MDFFLNMIAVPRCVGWIHCIRKTQAQKFLLAVDSFNMMASLISFGPLDLPFPPLFPLRDLLSGHFCADAGHLSGGWWVGRESSPLPALTQAAIIVLLHTYSLVVTKIKSFPPRFQANVRVRAGSSQFNLMGHAGFAALRP